MRLILTKNIEDNMKLAKPVYYNGRIMLNTGIENLHKYKTKLLASGIYHIYVEDEYSFDININEAIKESTRREGEKIILKTFNKVKQGSMDINVEEVDHIVEDIISDFINQEDILHNLVSLKNTSDYTFEHSLNVGVLCVVFGKFLGYSQRELYNIGMGGILHDIGKMLVPEEILNKPSGLCDYEYEVIKNHPELGFQYLQQIEVISPLSRIVVRAHHERVDGSGYPRGLKGDQIHEFAKIAAIADVFDALTSERIYRNRWATHKATEYILSKTDSFFDYELVRKLLPKIAAYPNGIEVILSNGAKGIVKSQNKDFPTRPIIRIFEDASGEKLNFDLDLMKHMNIVIENVIV